MNDSHRFGSMKVLSEKAWDFSPRLEVLEDRAAPGDAMLGMFWATSLAETALVAPQESSAVALSTDTILDDTPSVSVVVLAAGSAETESTLIKAPNADQQNEQAEQTQREAASLTSLLPASRVNPPKAWPMASPTSGQTLLDSGAPIAAGIRPAAESAPLGRPGDEAPVGAPVPLFAEGTEEGYIEGVYNSISRVWGDPRYQLGPRWSGAQGSPRALTWSLAPDGLNIPNGIGEGAAPNELFSRMDTLFASQGGRPTWIARIQSSLDRWTQLSGVSYTRITFGGNDWDDGASWGSAGSATRGDIRISMKPIDGASSVLAYNSYPSNGDMVLDRQENWSASTNTHRFMRNIIMHENGHGLGLAHVCSNNASFLMEPFLSTSFDGPQHDDIRGIQRHYGDPAEDDNTAAAATDIGALADDVTVNSTCNLPPPLTGSNPANSSNCSIDANAELDYFEFNVPSASKISVTVTPLGFTYNDNVQNSNGTCQTANSTNSLTRANLNVQLIGSDGTTVLATADANAAGIAETIANFQAPAGTFFIRVYEGDSPTQSQLYTFSVKADFTAGYLPPLNGGSPVDAGR